MKILKLLVVIFMTLMNISKIEASTKIVTKQIDDKYDDLFFVNNDVVGTKENIYYFYKNNKLLGHFDITNIDSNIRSTMTVENIMKNYFVIKLNDINNKIYFVVYDYNSKQIVSSKQIKVINNDYFLITTDDNKNQIMDSNSKIIMKNIDEYKKTNKYISLKKNNQYLVLDTNLKILVKDFKVDKCTKNYLILKDIKTSNYVYYDLNNKIIKGNSFSSYNINNSILTINRIVNNEIITYKIDEKGNEIKYKTIDNYEIKKESIMENNQKNILVYNKTSKDYGIYNIKTKKYKTLGLLLINQVKSYNSLLLITSDSKSIIYNIKTNEKILEQNEFINEITYYQNNYYLININENYILYDQKNNKTIKITDSIINKDNTGITLKNNEQITYFNYGKTYKYTLLKQETIDLNTKQMIPISNTFFINNKYNNTFKIINNNKKIIEKANSTIVDINYSNSTIKIIVKNDINKYELYLIK